MKEVKLYQCEVCGTQYIDKKDAEECEEFHAKGLEIDRLYYSGMNDTAEKFPHKILLKAKSVETRTYRL
jgi:hypothetical protein